jgi:hypothetical protein
MTAPPPSSAASARMLEPVGPVRVAGMVGAALAGLGALLGVVWEAWSPPGPLGAVLRAGVEPDETEAWAAGDGRYAAITVAVGVLAGIVAWYVRPCARARGAWVAVALGAGGIAGAALTDLVGWALRGTGSTFPCGTDTGRCVDHLPLTVHMHGLWFAEAVVAVLIYSLLVAFAADDDLGRPDPGRETARRLSRRRARREVSGIDEGSGRSVASERRVEDPWRDGHGPSTAYQRDLPPH